MREDAVTQNCGIGKLIEKLLDIESDNGITVRGEALSKSLMRLPESKVITHEEDARFWMPLYSGGGIEIKRLALQLTISGDIRRARGRASEHSERDEGNSPHFDTTPASPPEISDATFVRIRGSTSPPGDARYLGSHIGSNFSLYSLRPWKL